MSTASPFDADAPTPDGTVRDDATAPDRPMIDDGSPVDSPPERVPLRRSTTDKVVAGVAGGLGRYLGIDPVIIRIALVVLALTGGSGVLLYIIGWIAIPEEQPGEVPAGVVSPDRNHGIIVLGGVLMIAGGLLFADRLIPSFATFMGPLILVGLGAALVVGARR
ncbi:MAG TPA: PspC domain-containing protein [Euzebyales bacterium]